MLTHPFLDPIRTVRLFAPLTQNGGAVASVMSFAQDGLFLDPKTGKNTGIVPLLPD